MTNKKLEVYYKEIEELGSFLISQAISRTSNFSDYVFSQSLPKEKVSEKIRKRVGICVVVCFIWTNCDNSVNKLTSILNHPEIVKRLVGWRALKQYTIHSLTTTLCYIKPLTHHQLPPQAKW